MFVIGTAGHVDHGKSTLIEALTGIDPDRLAEEKAREMTIDLGFAWLSLGEDGEEVGIVDVPGHRDFIENMLAGIGGIDLALFVVAADEGVMPQTKEHLAILDLLQVSEGVVALTKIDVVDDPDWLELVTLEISETLSGTVLADVPIIPVSARTGEGLETLKRVLWERLALTSPKTDHGRPRMPIDRVFSLSGFGTIVTGTLLDGRFRVGDTVEIQPAGLTGRIRGLQTHKTKREEAQPGSRVAINLTGIGKDELKRGDVVAAPGTIGHTILLDAVYRHLPDNTAPLKHNMEVKLFIGAAEVVARTRVLGSPTIEPGKEGWLQLILQEPTALGRGDKFILRRPSPGTTLGGGRVLDPHPGRRHRRFRPEVITRLETLTKGTPAELLLQKLIRLEPVLETELIKQSGLTAETAETIIQELEGESQLVRLGQGQQIFSQQGWQQRQGKLLKFVQDFHKQHPLRLGMPREELRSRLNLPANVFNLLLAQTVNDALLVENGSIVQEPEFKIKFTPEQESAVQKLFVNMKHTGINSPSVKACKADLGEDVFAALVELGELRPLNNDVVYARNEYDQFTHEIKLFLVEHGRINAAQTRDLLNTSRKYAIALLEHLDHIKVTRRVGDDRELRQT